MAAPSVARPRKKSYREDGEGRNIAGKGEQSYKRTGYQITMTEFDDIHEESRRSAPILWNPDAESDGDAKADCDHNFVKPKRGHPGLGKGHGSNGERPVSVQEPSSAATSKKIGRPKGQASHENSTVPTVLHIVEGGSESTQLSRDPQQDKLSGVRYSTTILDMPSSERPRERFVRLGASALSAAELIALLVRTGSSERSALSLGDHLLAELGGLSRLAELSLEELTTIKGIGQVKAIEIKAAIELGNRVRTLVPEARPVVSSPQDVAALLQSELRYLKKEVLKSVLLDAKNRVIAVKTVSIGDLTSSIVHPREVFKDAIVASAASIIVAHNHPSGDPAPSTDDINITRRLISAGQTIGIELLDHIIIGDDKHVSLKEKGLI